MRSPALARGDARQAPAAGPLAIDFDAVSFGYASIGHSSLDHSPADTGTSDGDRVLHQISLSIGAGRIMDGQPDGRLAGCRPVYAMLAMRGDVDEIAGF